MMNLLYKELRLAAHPTLYIFSLMGILVLVPNYPYTVVFLFGCLASYITFFYGRETNDIYYTALLPVKKQDVVKGKCLLMVVTQVFSMAITVPCAILRTSFLPDGNLVGIEANVAFFGFGFIIYALFNLVFLTQFFVTAQKSGRAFLLASIPALLVMIIAEALVHFPGLEWLDSVAPDVMVRQLPILVVGVIVYVLANILAYRIASSRFLKVDL